MMTRRFAAVLASTALAGTIGSSSARAQAPTPAVFQVAPSSTAAADAARAFDAQREKFLASARAAYLDKTGRTPPPALDFPEPAAEVFASTVAALKSLEDQAAYVEAGRGSEPLPDYADMVVLVAAGLGVKPPESALAVYHDRVRLSTQPLTADQVQAAARLTAEVRDGAYKSRFLFLGDVVPVAVPRLKPPVVFRRGKRGRRRRARVVVAPPPEPAGPARSVLGSVDWNRAEELASNAAEGAQGWYAAASRRRIRRVRRQRRGRCYEWVRMALQQTGLWTDEYRSEVPRKGDWRRPRRAFSFAWAMNKLETRAQEDPADAPLPPLQPLDLRVDPLLIGSVIVFDRNVCGFNSSSGHIEVVSSIDPLRASSYKFHEVKLPCLVGAAIAGRVHVYVPRQIEPPAPVAAPAPTSASAPVSPTAG